MRQVLYTLDTDHCEFSSTISNLCLLKCSASTVGRVSTGFEFGLVAVSACSELGREGGPSLFNMAAKQEDGKWAGSISQVISAPLDKVWEILSDFDGIHKNFPQIFLGCETKEGEKNKVGSVRVLVVPTPDGPFEAKERLVVLDNEKHILSYSIEDNPFLTECKSVFTAEKHENDKTHVKWDFESNPSSIMTEEDFRGQQKMFISAILTGVGQKLSQ